MRDGTILLRHQGCEVSPVIQRSWLSWGDERWRGAADSRASLGFSRQQREEGETDLLRMEVSRRDGVETRRVGIRLSLTREDR